MKTAVSHCRRRSLLAVALLGGESRCAPPMRRRPTLLPRARSPRYKFTDSKIYPGTVRQVLGLCSPAVRPGQTSLSLCQSRWHPVQRPGGIRSVDRQARDARDDWRFRHPGPRSVHPADGPRPFQPQPRIRHADRRLRPLSDRRTAAGRRAAEGGHQRPADPALARRQRSLHCRRQQRSHDLRFTADLGARPDSFRRVFSTIGTYVDLRGGDCYPMLVRKSEPKPLRIYLQDGSQRS